MSKGLLAGFGRVGALFSALERNVREGCNMLFVLRIRIKLRVIRYLPFRMCRNSPRVVQAPISRTFDVRTVNPN